MKQIGFIGLGIMGKPMAANLLAAGYPLKAYFRDIEKSGALKEAGAEICSTIRNTVRDCDIIITMLPNSPQVKEVVLGTDGVIQHAKVGALLIDMSSIAPTASQEISQALKNKDIRMLDAPVSGGEPKAVDGTLAIMAGGDPSDFEEARPVFDVLGSSAILIGPIGAGNTTKLVNQIIVALNIAAVSEALTLANQSGIDPERVFEAIRGGLAGSTVLNAKVPMILDRNFIPGFKIDLHVKDLKNAIQTAKAIHSPVMLTETVLQMFENVQQLGGGQQDHSALIKYYEKLTGTEVCRFR